MELSPVTKMVSKPIEEMLFILTTIGVPPDVVDEMMDRVKLVYRKNAERQDGVYQPPEDISLPSVADIEQAKKNEILNELGRWRNEMPDD